MARNEDWISIALQVTALLTGLMAIGLLAACQITQINKRPPPGWCAVNEKMHARPPECSKDEGYAGRRDHI